MQLNAPSVIYLAQLMLMALTAGFLLWSSWQPKAQARLLRFAAATGAVTALCMAALWGDVSLAAPWKYYARFALMPLVALIAVPLFAMLYHIPAWDPRQRREAQLFFGLQALRLLYEGYWWMLRSVAMATEGRLIDQRPLLADLLAGATLIWLIVTIVRRMRRLQRHSGEFIAEAVLLGLLLIPSMFVQSAYTGGWIDRSTMEIVRDLGIVAIIPLVVLVFLDLLREAVTLQARLLGVALVVAMMTISTAGALLAPLFTGAQAQHTAMLRLSVLVVVVALLVLVGVPLLLKRSVFRPLEAVLSGVRQVNQGNLNVTVPVHFADEIGLLAGAFNRMVGDVRETVHTLEERVQARTAALAQSEGRYRDLVEQIDEVIFRIALPDLRVEYVSPSAERMLGFPIAALHAAPLFLGAQLHPDEAERAAERAAELARGNVAPQYEYRVRDAAGRERWLYQSNTAIYSDGRLTAIEGVCRDITDARQAEARLLEQQRELAALRERERIGRDLHDGLGQIAGYVNLQAQTANALITTGKFAEARSILNQLTHVAQDAHADIRRYILGLRTSADEPAEEPWGMTLRRTLGVFEQRYGIAVQLSCPASLPAEPFPPAVGREVLQIVVEALNNVHKHAAVSVVQVVVQQAVDAITLIVADNGAGFTPGAVERAEADRDRLNGLGLRMMAERAELVNAALQLDSAPGAGTQVVLRVPLRPTVLNDIEAPPLDERVQQARVLLVDDHPLFREGMRTMLTARGVQVVGAAEDGAKAQQLARRLRPDVILMDMQMPHCDGITATAAIKAELPDTKILMLTVAAEEENLFQALKAGAAGYLLKSLNSDEFFQLLAAAMRGEVALAPGLAAQTLEAFAQPPTGISAAAADNQPAQQRLLTLSPRQRDILERAAAGATYKEIAAALFISEATVKYHMGQIVELLQVANRREALALVRHAEQA